MQKKKMEFISLRSGGFKQVSDHYEITVIIYDGKNRIALEKQKFYVTTRVEDTLTNGDQLTAWEYYVRLQALFLTMG